MKKIKPLLFIILIAVLSYNPCFSQKNDSSGPPMGSSPGQKGFGKSWEVMQAFKISFIEQSIDFTETESERFWPLYHEHERRKKNITEKLMGPEYAGSHHCLRAMDTLSNEEAIGMIMDRFLKEQELLDLQMEFYQELTQFLPPKKTLQYYQTDKRFKKHLIERIRKPHRRPDR